MKGYTFANGKITTEGELMAQIVRKDMRKIIANFRKRQCQTVVTIYWRLPTTRPSEWIFWFQFYCINLQ